MPASYCLKLTFGPLHQFLADETILVEHLQTLEDAPHGGIVLLADGLKRSTHHHDAGCVDLAGLAPHGLLVGSSHGGWERIANVAMVWRVDPPVGIGLEAIAHVLTIEHCRI